MQSVLWDEAVKINGADSDYHRRDLWNAIGSGSFPEFELHVQLFTEEQANGFDFDVLDPTKLIPEELVPLTKVGRLVLDRNPDNFFAETEQVAFCPANIVPGIDFSNDPLLQGRLFSYLDTQLIRLGGPNFHQIPINAPKCPMHNFQRDGHMQTDVPKGRVAYEPNMLSPQGPREDPARGFRTVPRSESGGALRVRAEAFADHYTQARMFWSSQTVPEQNHIVSAFIFELSKVEIPAIRERVLGHLAHVDPALAGRVSAGLGLATVPPAASTGVPPREAAPSPALSIIKRANPTIRGRRVACLVTDGVDRSLIDGLTSALAAEGAEMTIVAPRIGGVVRSDGNHLPADGQLAGNPSVLFDAVVLALGPDGGASLQKESAAVDFVRDAFQHLKVIGHTIHAGPLLAASGVESTRDEGVVLVDDHGTLAAFVAAARSHRIWAREARVRTLF